MYIQFKKCFNPVAIAFAFCQKRVTIAAAKSALIFSYPPEQASIQRYTRTIPKNLSLSLFVLCFGTRVLRLSRSIRGKPERNWIVLSYIRYFPCVRPRFIEKRGTDFAYKNDDTRTFHITSTRNNFLLYSQYQRNNAFPSYSSLCT